jgi:hypothetical protein
MLLPASLLTQLHSMHSNRSYADTAAMDVLRALIALQARARGAHMLV